MSTINNCQNLRLYNSNLKMYRLNTFQVILNKIPHNYINKRTKTKSSAEYCLELIRKHDYENFVCTLLLTNSIRSNAIAIRSFNIEISKIAEQITQQTIGLMRIKFWEDTIDKCLNEDIKNIPKHPVAIELHKANKRCKFSKRYLKNLIDSRRNNLNIATFDRIEDMEKYAEKSVSNVYYLILEGCDVRNVNADHAASHLGKAQGIVQQLRCLPQAKELNFIPIPREILIKHHISDEDIIRNHSNPEITECVYEMASRAWQHLEKSRKLANLIPKQAANVFLPAIAVTNYLERLQQVDYNVYHPSLKYRTWKYLPQLWWANWRGHF